MDNINVIDLPPSGGMMQDWPQPYEMTVVPPKGKERPELDFLHKGDGITLGDTSYTVDQAKQVLVDIGTPYWTWVYRVTKDESDTSKGEPW